MKRCTMKRYSHTYKLNNKGQNNNVKINLYAVSWTVIGVLKLFMYTLNWHCSVVAVYAFIKDTKTLISVKIKITISILFAGSILFLCYVWESENW